MGPVLPLSESKYLLVGTFYHRTSPALVFQKLADSLTTSYFIGELIEDKSQPKQVRGQVVMVMG